MLNISKITWIVLMNIFFINSFAQMTAQDYIKALWMTTRMYGGQRSGDGYNWLIMNHSATTSGKTKVGQDFTEDKDPADGWKLTGGWHDCGDHVKYGQT